jgi:hypothetical protein
MPEISIRPDFRSLLQARESSTFGLFMGRSVLVVGSKSYGSWMIPVLHILGLT